MEEKTLTFEEKLEKLLELARKKKNVLEQKEIIDFFHGEILSLSSWIRLTNIWKIIRWTCWLPTRIWR